MASFSKVPDGIRAEIAALEGPDFVVGATLIASLDDVANGKYASLGVSVKDGEVQVPQPYVPEESTGKHSRWNRTGREILRPDLPKVRKTIFTRLMQPYGNPYASPTVVDMTKNVTQRQLIYGAQLRLVVEATVKDGKVVALVRLDRTFDREDVSDRDLVHALSIVRENTGTASVLPADTQASEWLERQYVEWEILPVGTAPERDDAVRRIVEAAGVEASSERGRILGERSKLAFSLAPENVIVGTSGFSRYYGFMYADDLVLMENLEYGNAAYLFYEDWRVVSQRSRLDLLANPDEQYDRVVHSAGWEDRLRTLLRKKGHYARRR